MRIAFRLYFAGFLAVSAFAQLPSPPAFEAADVRVSPHSTNPGVRGGYYITGARYELHHATMADLIRIAWGLNDNNRVLAGPAWLEDTRFDVLAKAPDSTTPETAKLMLRTLLRDRCQLTVHDDRRPMQAYALTRGKRALQIKEASGQGNQTNVGTCRLQPSSANPGAVPVRVTSCRGITMEAFATELPGLASDYFGHLSMADLSGLKGSWDFDLKWTPRGQLRPGGEGVSLFDAIDKQLGLSLDLQEVSLPVIVVDRVNEKPAVTTSEEIRKLPRTPAEFEVADIKPSPPGETSVERILPGGQVELRNITLNELMLYAWDIAGAEGSDDQLLAGPKWIQTERFDVVAKAVSEDSSTAPPLDESALRLMMRNLLIARFKIASHYEDRPVTVYNLTASKPKLTKADPASRTQCKITTLATGVRSALTRNFACQNVTMSGFAERLRDLATDYIDHPVVNSTGLEGGWNFTLSFHPAK